MGEKENMNTMVYNIGSLIDEDDEKTALDYISSFSCEREKDGTKENLNPDIERFLKKGAIQSARLKTSITYLVIDMDDSALLDYFTLAHKPLTISAEGLSRKFKDNLKRFSALDEKTNTYTVSAFLLAQFGKNYAVENGSRITGSQLMMCVRQKLREAQKIVGGKIEYLDCEPNAELINFYESQGYTLFGERTSEKENKRYLQYLKFE